MFYNNYLGPVNQLLDNRRNDAFFKKKKRQSIHLRYEDPGAKSAKSRSKNTLQDQENDEEFDHGSSRARKRSSTVYEDFDQIGS